jgi:hypothetical protein
MMGQRFCRAPKKSPAPQSFAQIKNRGAVCAEIRFKESPAAWPGQKNMK